MNMMDHEAARWRAISEFSKVELLSAREEISKREQEISTRALVVTGVSGVMFTFLIDSYSEKLGSSFVAFCLIAISLLTALLSLFRWNMRTKSLDDLAKEFELKREWTPTHVYNMMISENLKIRQTQINRFNKLSVVSLVSLILGTLIYLFSAAVEF